MKRKTGADGYDRGASREGYRQAPPDKKGMNCGNRGGEADHAADGGRGVLGELGNRQRQPIEPIRMSGYAAADGRKDRQIGKCSAGENKGGRTTGSAAADDENPKEAVDSGRGMVPHTKERRAEDEAGEAHRDTTSCTLARPLLAQPEDWATMSRRQRKYWLLRHKPK